MRIFGSDRVKSVVGAMGIADDEAIEAGMLTKAIGNAQKNLESRNFDTRKHVLQYDEVMNEQREVIYAERRQVLNGENMRDVIVKMMNDIVENAVDMSVGDDQPAEKWDYRELNDLIRSVIPLEPILYSEAMKGMKKNKKGKKEEEPMNVRKERLKIIEDALDAIPEECGNEL